MRILCVLVHSPKMAPFFMSKGGSSNCLCAFFLKDSFWLASIMSFSFLLIYMLCFLITRLISLDAEMMPRIKSSSFSTLFSRAVMLSLLNTSGLDSRLLKLRGIFWLKRFARGLLNESYRFRVNFCGKKSLGSFWCDMMIDRLKSRDI